MFPYQVISEMENMVVCLANPNVPLNISIEDCIKNYGGLKELDILDEAFKVKEMESFHNEPWWVYVKLLLAKLYRLKYSLEVCPEEKHKLLSIKEKQCIAITFDIIISIGLIAQMKHTQSTKSRFLDHSRVIPLITITDEERSQVLQSVTKLFFTIYEQDDLRKIILQYYLDDLIAALIHSQMELQTFEKREFFVLALKSAIETNYQPAVMKALMLLRHTMTNPKDRFKHFIHSQLNQRIAFPGGVTALIRAILECTDDVTPNYWKSINTLAKLLAANLRITKKLAFNEDIYNQILELLNQTNKNYVHVVVSTIRIIYDNTPDKCFEFILKPIFEQLYINTNEEKISRAIQQIHNCFAIPASDVWNVPSRVMTPFTNILFTLNKTVRRSVYYKKQQVEDLLWVLFYGNVNDSDSFAKVLKEILFKKSGIQYKFKDGSLCAINLLTNPKEYIHDDNFEEEFIELFLKRKNNPKVNLVLCESFIKIVSTDYSSFPHSIRLEVTSLLGNLFQNEKVICLLKDNPQSMIDFLLFLIKEKFTGVVLVTMLHIISYIMLDIDYSKHSDKYNALKKPLKKLKKSHESSDVRAAADSLFCLIMTKGAVKTKPNGSLISEKEVEAFVASFEEAMQKCSKKESKFETALEMSFNETIPIKANGLRLLTQAIIEKDKETIENQEKIICLFKESLKHTDSFVYLSAIHGLASLASLNPDDILISLIDQYSCCEDPALKIKVGEVLMRTSRNLGEMAISYKREYINCFLAQAQHSHPTVRASSISNLGEICEILSFRISAYLLDIFLCIKSIFDSEKEEEPKRAAVLLFTSLIRGMGTDGLKCMEEFLPDLYRKLKLISQTEKEVQTRMHAELALAELNRCTLQFLKGAARKHMEKHIFVLNPPLD